MTDPAIAGGGGIVVGGGTVPAFMILGDLINAVVPGDAESSFCDGSWCYWENLPLWWVTEGAALSPAQPSSGPLTALWTGSRYIGIQANAPGVLTVATKVACLMVVREAMTLTFSLRQNGVAIATATRFHPFGLNAFGAGWEVTVPDVVVADGDVFDVTVSVDQGVTFFYAPGGISNSEYLSVTGSLGGSAIRMRGSGGVAAGL